MKGNLSCLNGVKDWAVGYSCRTPTTSAIQVLAEAIGYVGEHVE